MRTALMLSLVLSLSACGKKKPATQEPTPPAPAAQENKNPYHDVRPQKIKDDVEKIQKQEEERNDKRYEQMKGE